MYVSNCWKTIFPKTNVRPTLSLLARGLGEMHPRQIRTGLKVQSLKNRSFYASQCATELSSSARSSYRPTPSRGHRFFSWLITADLTHVLHAWKFAFPLFRGRVWWRSELISGKGGGVGYLSPQARGRPNPRVFSADYTAACKSVCCGNWLTTVTTKRQTESEREREMEEKGKEKERER